MAIDKKQISQYTLYFIAAMMVALVTIASNLPSKKSISKLWVKYSEVNQRMSTLEAKAEGFNVGHDGVADSIKELKEDIRRLRERIIP